MSGRSDERRGPALAQEPVVRGQRRRSPRPSSSLAALGGFVLLPYAQPDLQARRLLGRDLQRGGLVRRQPSSAPRRSSRTSRPRRVVDDIVDAEPSEPGVDRPRRHARPAMRDLPRADRRQPGRFPEPRRPVRQRDLQGAEGLQVGRARQRGDEPVRGRSRRAGHGRSRGLLRLSAAPARLPPRPGHAGAPHRRERRARCAASRRAAPATAAWTTRRAAPGSRASRPSTSSRSCRPSRRARAATTSASRCATSRGG